MGMLLIFVDVENVKVVGVKFGVVFGVIDKLLDVCEVNDLLLLFGVVILFEVMCLLECGYIV